MLQKEYLMLNALKHGASTVVSLCDKRVDKKFKFKKNIPLNRFLGKQSASMTNCLKFVCRNLHMESGEDPNADNWKAKVSVNNQQAIYFRQYETENKSQKETTTKH